MRVLFIGHYREESGWGRAARDYIKSLITVGVDVVCRPIIIRNEAQLPDWLLECENKPSGKCDYCIQHLLPHYFSYSSNFKKTVGMFATETSSLGISNWAEYINLMDAGIVFCTDSRNACIDSNVNIPLHVIPHATDIEKYKKEREKIILSPGFKFYGIGEWHNRKNWGAIIGAFHREFDPSEPVELVLKINAGKNVNPHDLANEVINSANKIKTDMKLYKSINDYKPDIVLPVFLEEEEIYSLHQTCDCYVSASFGEAANFGCLDAIGFGKFPVCTNQGGPKDMITNYSTGLLVNASQSPVIGIHNTFDTLFTGHETWSSIDVVALGNRMRLAYNLLSGSYKEEIQRDSEKAIQEFSYEKIGERLVDVLKY